MLEHAERISKWVCLLLALLVVYRLARLLARPSPLEHLKIPAVLTVTNSPKPTHLHDKPSPAKTGSHHIAPHPAHRGSQLPPEIQTELDHINESEIFGPVPHPLPMALLGIAGSQAFLRTPNGQSGPLKEGESLGGIKLLRIGINRVLIEEEGQEKELTLFSGLGSESLLSKPKEKHP